MYKLLKDVSTRMFGQRYFIDPSKGGAASGGPDGQGDSGGNLSDIDPALSDVNLEALSKLPEGDRKAVLDSISTKVKNLQAIGTKKSEEYAIKLESVQAKLADAKIVEDIRNNPDLSKAIEKTIDDFKTGKLNSKTEASDIFEGWLDKAQSKEERDNIIGLRDKIESGTKTSRDELKMLKEEIASIKAATQSIYSDRAIRGVDILKEKFGKEVVDKYSTKLISAVSRSRQREGENFDAYMENLFLNVATPEDYRSAFRNETQLKEKRDTARRRDGLEPGGGGEAGKDVEVPRDKNGKVNIGQYASNLVKNLGLGKNLS